MGGSVGTNEWKKEKNTNREGKRKYVLFHIIVYTMPLYQVVYLKLF
jgi:hypothetical protein